MIIIPTFSRKNYNYFLMEIINKNLLVLVYYKVRGKLQPIRNLLFYLALPFVEIHLDNEQQKKSLPQEAVNCLKGVRIDKSSLPLLVFEGLFIYDIYPIMAYLCRRFKREDLLGRDIRQRARLQEILQIFFTRQPNSMSELFKLADFCADKKQDEIMREKKAYMEKFFNESGYLREICIMLERQGSNGCFVLSTMTILDFLFLQSCHYMLGMFNTIDVKRMCPITHVLRDFFTGPEEAPPQEFKYLGTMRNFLAFMYELPFYAQNKDYLESFSLISDMCASFTEKRIKGLKRMWSYKQSFVQ